MSATIRVPRAAAVRLAPAAPLVALLVALLAPGGASADLDRGEALYANHCHACHEPNVHTRETRRVDSREELGAWVAAWSAHAGLDWGDEEIESVTRYLSREVYGFTR